MLIRVHEVLIRGLIRDVINYIDLLTGLLPEKSLARHKKIRKH